MREEELIRYREKQSENEALQEEKFKTLNMSFLLLMYNNVQYQVDGLSAQTTLQSHQEEGEGGQVHDSSLLSLNQYFWEFLETFYQSLIYI